MSEEIAVVLQIVLIGVTVATPVWIAIKLIRISRKSGMRKERERIESSSQQLHTSNPRDSFSTAIHLIPALLVIFVIGVVILAVVKWSFQMVF